jgi:hypothetical protein
MREQSQIKDTPVLERISKVLHDTLDDIRHEPVPERWVELINRLNTEEAAPDKRGH